MTVRSDRLVGALPDLVDVVVVGAGAGGTVVASRLSEKPGLRVLLLESGALRSDPDAAVPGLALGVLATGAVHHDVTVPQAALGGRRISSATGHAVGGGSAVNTMSWFQGHPSDYDGWAAAGATGWGWDEMGAALRGIENHVLGPSEYHGAGGPMTVSLPADLEALHYDFLEAGEQIGLPISEDLNGEVRHGVGQVQVTIRGGRRFSVLDGYLSEAMGRPNLTVRMETRVERVVLDGNRAVGVVADGRLVRARRVVLCAGALRTPQLLMVSGIGPHAHLRDHGIEVVRDLPGVGADLQDHPQIRVSWTAESGRTLLNVGDEKSQREYRLARRGLLATYGPVVAMLPGPKGGTRPEIEILMALLRFDAEMMPLPDPAATALTMLLAPKSRGSVRLASASVVDPPLIDPGYLSDPEDLTRLRGAIGRAEELFRTPALRRAAGKRLDPPPEVDSPDELEDYIRSTVGSLWHHAGTARMGTDPGAVVNPVTMSIHGVAGLYVADASVMPTLPRGHTQAPTIAIGERVASKIAAE